MSKIFYTSLLMVFALALSAFGQIPVYDPPVDAKLPIMFGHWLGGTKKCASQWDTAFTARNKAFTALAEKIKEGDTSKIRLYMNRARKAQSEVASAWACGSDYSRNLEKEAGVALSDTDSLFQDRITEAQYDEAMKLVKTLRKKIADRPPTEDQKKIWSEAWKASGVPESAFYKLE